jgi:hypothetical protein
VGVPWTRGRAKPPKIRRSSKLPDGRDSNVAHVLEPGFEIGMPTRRGTGRTLLVGPSARQRLQVRAEGEQAAIAVLHNKLAGVPRHVSESASEFYAVGCVLGI